MAIRGIGAVGLDPSPSPVETYVVGWPWGAYLGSEALEVGVDACVSTWNRPAPNTFPTMSKAGGHYLNSQLMKMEAVANGCLPVVPDRLAYPEIYPSRHRYQSDLIDPAREARSAASLVGDLWERTLAGQVRPPDVSPFTRDALRGAYCELFGASGVASG